MKRIAFLTLVTASFAAIPLIAHAYPWPEDTCGGSLVCGSDGGGSSPQPVWTGENRTYTYTTYSYAFPSSSPAVTTTQDNVNSCVLTYQ